MLKLVWDNVIENSVYGIEVNAFKAFYYYGVKLFTDYLHIHKYKFEFRFKL